MADPQISPPVAPISGQRRQSLSGRVVARTLTVGVVVLVSVIGVNHYLSLRLLRQLLTDLARNSALTTVIRIEEVFQNAMTSADTLAREVEDQGITPALVEESIVTFVRSESQVYGMAVALEPYALYEGVGRFSPYYYRSGRDVVFRDLAAADYDYLEWDWYTVSKTSGLPAWTEPYYDTGGGNTLMTTYSTPIRGGDSSRFVGVATADISLDWLQELAEAVHIGDAGFGFIVSKGGIVVAHSDESKKTHDITPPHASLRAAAATAVEPGPVQNEADLWRDQLAGLPVGEPAQFVAPCHHTEGNCWVAVHPLLDTGWRVVVVVPEKELSSRIFPLTVKISILAIAGLIVLAVILNGVTRGLMKPLGRLASAASDIGSGNLDIELPQPKTQDEIGALTRHFRAMRDSLKSYIAELEKTTAKEQRLETEIAIARGIQMSMVPGHGEVSARGDRYDVFGSLRPARIIGGDLYYIAKDGDRVSFIVGDVSDKGVPAAIFMAKTVTLYTGLLDKGLRPGDALASMNEALLPGNDSCMFVTALCGVLDLTSGELVMANAGHMHPVRRSPSGCDELTIESETALGLVGNLRYPDVSCVLEPGTSLILYTDGISEAFDGTGEAYGKERILTLAAGASEASAEGLGRDLLADVDRFADTNEQSDDITLLIVRYLG